MNIDRALLESKASLPLAAERLGLREDELIAALGNVNRSEVLDSLRFLLSLKMFDLLMQTHIAFEASLSDLEPKDLARSYLGMVEQFSQLSQRSAANNSAEEIDADESPDAIRESIAGKLVELSDRRSQGEVPGRTNGRRA